MGLKTIDDVLEIVDVGASEIESGDCLTVQIKGPQFSEDETDAESIEDAPVFSALGVVARPYPADESGNAQGALIRGANVLVGMRDTRSANVVGALKPGDTCVHSTGPDHASRLFLKEETRQVVLMSKNSSDKDMVFTLDGTNDTIVLSAFGMAISIDKTTGVTLSSGAASIQLTKDGSIVLSGKVMIGSLAAAPVVDGNLKQIPGLFVMAPV